MANVTTGQVLYFDSTTGASVDRQLRVCAILWTSNEGVNLDIAADDDLLIKDIEDVLICGKRAEAAGDGLELVFGFPGLILNGIKVTAMDGGVVFVICNQPVV